MGEFICIPITIEKLPIPVIVPTICTFCWIVIDEYFFFFIEPWETTSVPENQATTGTNSDSGIEV